MYQKYWVELTEAERYQLKQFVSSGTAPARQIRRAQILLKSDCGPKGPNRTYEAICESLDVSNVTVTAVRRAFVEGGLEAVLTPNDMNCHSVIEERPLVERCPELVEGWPALSAGRIETKGAVELLVRNRIAAPREIGRRPCGNCRMSITQTPRSPWWCWTT